MKIDKIILSIFITGALFSCSNNSSVNDDSENQIEIEQRISIPKTKADFIINQLRPKSQHFEIDANSDFYISAENGTQIYIPSNSFIDENGKSITGKVVIELIEILSVTDFVKMNLQTLSNSNLLQSEGMLFIDAKSDGIQVQLNPNKKLQIELPKLENTSTASDIRIFKGTYDKSANINWNEIGTPEKQLVPLPLDLFNYVFRCSHKFKRAINDNGFEITELAKLDKTTLFDKKFENTLITTREFEERFWTIWQAGWVMGQYNNIYGTKATEGTTSYDYTILNFYINNTDKELFFCDSLAYSSFKYWKENTDGINPKYQTLNIDDVLIDLKKYCNERLGMVYQLSEDIDYRDSNIINILSNKGLNENEIDEILGVYERQNKIITARKNKQSATKVLTNSFSVSELGWINCDQFYNNPNAKESNIIASVSNLDEYEFVTMNLIINGRRIAINGKSSDNLEYTFTGKSKPYTRLPIGEKATIFALSFKNDKPYIGIKEFVISEKESFNIELVESSLDDINEKLKGIN